MKNPRISIDSLIEIVTNGGKIKTGIGIFNKHDILLLKKMCWLKMLIPCLILKKTVSWKFRLTKIMPMEHGIGQEQK